MNRHQYGNTETFHLWRAWEEASGKPIASVMKGWTEQMGFPLVEACGDRDLGGGWVGEEEREGATNYIALA